MMIVCFIRSDDTQGWNKNCSNPLLVPVQLLGCGTEGRGCPTGPAAEFAAVPQHTEHPAALGHHLSCQHRDGLTLSDPSWCWTSPAVRLGTAGTPVPTSQQCSCPAQTPGRSFSTHSLRPSLYKTAHPVPLLWVTAASSVRTQRFVPIFCITLVFQADVLELKHRNTLRENPCFAPSEEKQLATHNSCAAHVIWDFPRCCCCHASPQTGSLTCHWNQRRILNGRYLHKNNYINTRLTDQTRGKKYSSM